MKPHYIALLLLIGCSPAWHLKRSQIHLNKALQKGAQVSTDTVFVEVVTEKTVTDTVVKVNEVDRLFTDTITIETTRWKSRTRIDTVTKKIYQQVECKPDTLRVPVKVETVISVPHPIKWWYLIIAALVGAGAFAILRR